MGFLDFIANVMSGGLLGLLGSIASKAAEFLLNKQKMQMRQIELAHEFKMQELSISARARELEHEFAITETRAWGDARVSSYEHDSGYGKLEGWAVFMLRMVRPLLTIMLIVITAIVYFDLPGNQKADMAMQITFLAALAISWWFGDRYKKGKDNG